MIARCLAFCLRFGRAADASFESCNRPCPSKKHREECIMAQEYGGLRWGCAVRVGRSDDYRRGAMGTLVNRVHAASAVLLGAAGIALAQSWLPLIGLVADGYRGGDDLGTFAGPMWFGTAAGLLGAYAGWFVLVGRAGRSCEKREASHERPAGLALACVLVGCMALAATRGAGTWTGPLTFVWQVAVFAGSFITAFGGGALTCVWVGRCHAVGGVPIAMSRTPSNKRGRPLHDPMDGPRPCGSHPAAPRRGAIVPPRCSHARPTWARRASRRA